MRYVQRTGSAEWNKRIRLEFSDGNATVILDNTSEAVDYEIPATNMTSFVKIVVETVYATCNNGAREIEFRCAPTAPPTASPTAPPT
eukprot:gene58101-biopygen10615